MPSMTAVTANGAILFEACLFLDFVACHLVEHGRQHLRLARADTEKMYNDAPPGLSSPPYRWGNVPGTPEDMPPPVCLTKGRLLR